ncbi:MAG: sensor histidine kinase, partial [Bacilli bacterium]|nr:sensor histidine kinase [Bacilli bacterium]
LYYVRSELVEKDYFIQSHSLKKLVSLAIKKNKDAFICRNIKLDMSGVSGTVLTDGKWMLFILNQILSNCCKYQNKKNAQITIWTEVHQTMSILKIRDNGIGIDEADLSRVFEKGFTGINGRNVMSSTGMGLYICKRLIDQLGHEITIQSQLNEFTEVSIIFSQTDYFDVFS